MLIHFFFKGFKIIKQYEERNSNACNSQATLGNFFQNLNKRNGKSFFQNHSYFKKTGKLHFLKRRRKTNNFQSGVHNPQL